MTTKKTAKAIVDTRIAAIEKGIRVMLDNNAPIKKIRAYLTMEDFSDKEASELLARLGIKGKKKGFTLAFNAWLAEKPRTIKEAEEVIMGLGELGETTQNTKNHKSLYINTAELAARIWERASNLVEEKEEASK